MVWQDQQPVLKRGSPFHGKAPETEHSPALRSLLPALGAGRSGPRVLPSGGGHSHGASLKQRGLCVGWEVEGSDGI